MESSSNSGPNFFIAGAPKAGTTSLYHALRRHPQIFMSPVKEPSYFSSEIRVQSFAPDLQPLVREQAARIKAGIQSGVATHEAGGIVSEWSDYQQLFHGAKNERAVGEASVCYLWSETAPGAIATCVPQAKIILILRDPSERAFSQYLHYLSDGYPAHSFAEHIRKSLKHRGEYDSYHPFLEYGLYGEQLDRYLSFFSWNQIRVWLYEDTLAEPLKFLREVLEFLEVDPDFSPGKMRRYYEMEIPRASVLTSHLRRSATWNIARRYCPLSWKKMLKAAAYLPKGSRRLEVEDRRFLVNFYRADIERLQAILHRDLSSWLG
jgi:hypothetical protein